jgi:hypothetical protein
LHTKVLEVEPIVEFVNGAFVGSSKWIPPRSNGSILNVDFLQGRGFFVPITKGFVLIMELRCNQLLGVFVKRLNPMEKTCSLFVNHLDHRISNPTNNLNNIPIFLHIICHEPLENEHTQPFLLNNCIQLLPQNALSFYVLEVHVTNRNHHNLTINWVINMTGHGRPSLNTFTWLNIIHAFCRSSLGCICWTKSNPDVTLLTNILNK